MRYLVGFVLALAVLAAPLGVTAQEGNDGAPVEPSAGETAPRSEPAAEPAPEEPALELKLDDAGVGVVPPPLRTTDGYTLEQMELRVKRAKIGIGSSAAAFFVGGILLAFGLSGDCFWGSADRESCDRRAYAGTALLAGGTVGMIVSGGLLGARKRKLRELQEAHYTTPRRAQWDLARSRLVF